MSEIQQFYEGQTIFLTGGTGFVGKILLEKLLRGCPGISKIYLLIRTKKRKTIQERIEELNDSPIFETLKQKNPNFMKKIVPLAGDILKPELGLSVENRALLTKEVSIIFHGAATTKFNEPLRVAVAINVNSLLDLIKISRDCKKLKALVYLSTAFIQCTSKTVEEKIYPTPMTHEEINNTVQIISRRNLSKHDEIEFTKILLGDFPNTYVFTKSIAEGLLNENARDLPICIFRFPITLSTYKEPLPGWVDTLQGFNTALIEITLGRIHLFHLNTDVQAHLVPADFVCNALIVSAWETSTRKNELPEELPVYNLTSCKENLFFWGNFIRCVRNLRPTHTPTNCIYYPDCYMVKSLRLFYFWNFFMHLIPVLLIDIVLRVLRKKPIAYKKYKNGIKLLNLLSFFINKKFTFQNNRVQSMWNKLSTVDKELMPFDLVSLDWADVVIVYWEGILKYIIKDDMSQEGRKHAINRLQKLYIIHRFLQLLFVTFLIWLICKLF